jgi:hypothetical protein
MAGSRRSDRFPDRRCSSARLFSRLGRYFRGYFRRRGRRFAFHRFARGCNELGHRAVAMCMLELEHVIRLVAGGLRMCDGRRRSGPFCLVQRRGAAACWRMSFVGFGRCFRQIHRFAFVRVLSCHDEFCWPRSAMVFTATDFLYRGRDSPHPPFS